MGGEWVRRPLAELGEIVTGTTPPSSEPALFGQVHPFLTPSDMTYDARHVATERFLSKEGGSRFDSRMLPAGSVSFVCIGATIGKVAMTQVATLTNQQINSIVVDSENHHPDFTYYLLRQYAPEIRQHAGGAATPILNKTAFSRIELPIPPLPVQRKIAAVLLAYDVLIENNLRRIEILEEMAQAVYREWFVNFRSPGHEDVPLVDSPIGPIPDGWDAASFGDVAENHRKIVNPWGSLEEEFDHFSFAAFDAGGLPSTESAETMKSGKLLVDGDSILLAKLNPRIPRVWFARPRGVRRSVASSEFLVLTSRGDMPLELVYAIASDPSFQSKLATMSGGTSTSHQRLKLTDLVQLPIPVAPAEVVQAFGDLTGPMYRLVSNLLVQNTNLRATRDLLLPRLVSGDIDVSDLDIDTEWLAS